MVKLPKIETGIEIRNSGLEVEKNTRRGKGYFGWQWMGEKEKLILPTKPDSDIKVMHF
jgi:hypothetical protein